MTKLYNRVGHTCTTTGTGTVTLGAALGAVNTNVCSYQTMATAGASDGEVVPYLIYDSNGAWEYGTGTYTASGTTLSRTLGKSSTGSLLSLTASSQVFLPARAEDVAKLLDNNTFTGSNTLAAGTTALAPLTFQSGTNLTTATAGVMEYDGTVPYFTHATNERGVVPAVQWCRLSSTYTLASQTAAQKLFNSSTNGAVTVAGSTTYEFECNFNLTSMGATNNWGFAIGGAATLTSIRWISLAIKGSAAVGTPAVFTSSSASISHGWLFNDTAANTAIDGAGSTGTVGQAEIKGIICVNGGGTIIPQVSLGTAAAAVVGINSYFKIWPIGTNTQTTLGNWS